MLGQVDGSIYFWPRTIAEAASAPMRGAAWVLRPTMRAIALWVAAAEIRRLTNKIYEVERDRRLAVKYAERAAAQRDRYYRLYMQSLNAKSAA